MTTYTTIEAQSVRPGDRIYNSHAYHPSAAWVTVKSVDLVGEYTRIRTVSYDKWLHPREGIAVERRD